MAKQRVHRYKNHPLNGQFIIIHKEQGFTSHDVVSKLRRLLNIKRIGHTGTLDPMATGVLPIAIGKATKCVDLLSGVAKEYEAILQLGTSTTTLDAEGDVVERVETKDIPEFDDKILKSIEASLLGKQEQAPPMYSAVKVKGKKLYEYARKGEVITRKTRTIRVHELSLDKLSPTQIKIKTRVSSGTYIRVLGESVAKAMGTVGHLVALCRTKVCDFDLSSSVTLSDLSEKLEVTNTNINTNTNTHGIYSLQKALNHIGKITISNALHQKLLLGGQIQTEDNESFTVDKHAEYEKFIHHYALICENKVVGICESIESLGAEEKQKALDKNQCYKTKRMLV